MPDLLLEADKTEQVWFCACKRSGKEPVCDGSYKRLGSSRV